MKLTIAWIGKTRSAAVQTLTDEYLGRLRQFADCEGVSLRDENALLRLCGREGRNPRLTLVLFDSRGKQLSSEEFAAFLSQTVERDSKPLLFAIGPADGFTESTRVQADQILSLGRMTLAHELARIVVLEQLYRAFTILKGHPYHLGH